MIFFFYIAFLAVLAAAGFLILTEKDHDRRDSIFIVSFLMCVSIIILACIAAHFLPQYFENLLL